ncbi:MAG: copper transporter [Beutenbergiaceae bacterium]
MIDFRYHIVSLIAVFLALAVGIVLGAGPLQQPIGDQLTEQVEQLRQEKEELRVELEATQAHVERQRTFIEAASGRLLEGALTDVAVSVVALPDADPTLTDSLVAMMERAGADLVANFALTPAWVDSDNADQREELAADLQAQLSIPVAQDAEPAQILGRVLGQALTAIDPLDSTAIPDSSTQAYTSLEDAGLLAQNLAPTTPAEVVLVIAPAPSDDDETDLTLELQTLVGMGDAVVLAGHDGNDENPDLVSMVRASATAASVIATVDSVDEVAGQVLVPLAVQVMTFEQVVGHYGLAADATAIVPPVVERPVETVPDPDPSTDAESTDGPEPSPTPTTEDDATADAS